MSNCKQAFKIYSLCGYNLSSNISLLSVGQRCLTRHWIYYNSQKTLKLSVFGQALPLVISLQRGTVYSMHLQIQYMSKPYLQSRFSYIKNILHPLIRLKCKTSKWLTFTHCKTLKLYYAICYYCTFEVLSQKTFGLQ